MTNQLAEALDPFLGEAAATTLPAAVVHVLINGEAVYERAVGWLDPETKQSPARLDTLFDLASLTKLFTATAFLQLVAAGKVELDTPVVEVLPTFKGQRPIQPYEDPLQPGAFIRVSEESGTVDAGQVTFRHLLTHTSGLPAWRPLYRAPDTIEAAVLESFFAYPTGSRVIYSDLGFILLGWAIASLSGQPLDQAIAALVTTPLDQGTITYGPVPAERAAPTEWCAWRNRRIRGEVHDENAYAMGGVSGHAGLFGAAADVAALGQVWLEVTDRTPGVGSRTESGPAPYSLLPTRLAQEAVSLQAEDGATRRGLGWGLWSPDPDSAGHSFNESAFGHTGFTGTSLYIDPECYLAIACLTDEVYGGREGRSIMPFRIGLHRRVAEVLC